MKNTKIFVFVFLLSGLSAHAESTTAGSAIGGTSITGSMMPRALPETQFQQPAPAVQQQGALTTDQSDAVSTQDSSTSTITCVTNESNDSVCGTNAEKFCNSHPDSEQCSTQEINFE